MQFATNGSLAGTSDGERRGVRVSLVNILLLVRLLPLPMAKNRFVAMLCDTPITKYNLIIHCHTSNGCIIVIYYRKQLLNSSLRYFDSTRFDSEIAIFRRHLSQRSRDERLS